MRSSIPDSLLEAARIDGASEFKIYPVGGAADLPPDPGDPRRVRLHGRLERLHVAADGADPGVIFHRAVALALSREHVQESELMMAGSVVTILPVMLLFIFVQRTTSRASPPAASRVSSRCRVLRSLGSLFIS